MDIMKFALKWFLDRINERSTAQGWIVAACGKLAITLVPEFDNALVNWLLASVVLISTGVSDGVIIKSAGTGAKSLALVLGATLLLALAPSPHANAAGLAGWNRAITADMLADVSATKALADAQGDTIAAACYGELVTSLAAMQAAQLKNDLPKVHLLWDFQRARGLYQATKSDSKLSVSCAPLAQQIKTDVLGFVNLALAGGLTIAKVGPLFGLP